MYNTSYLFYLDSIIKDSIYNNDNIQKNKIIMDI